MFFWLLLLLYVIIWSISVPVQYFWQTFCRSYRSTFVSVLLQLHFSFSYLIFNTYSRRCWRPCKEESVPCVALLSLFLLFFFFSLFLPLPFSFSLFLILSFSSLFLSFSLSLSLVSHNQFNRIFIAVFVILTLKSFFLSCRSARSVCYCERGRARVCNSRLSQEPLSTLGSWGRSWHFHCTLETFFRDLECMHAWFCLHDEPCGARTSWTLCLPLRAVWKLSTQPQWTLSLVYVSLLFSARL